jgi:hypothetical protein
LSTLNADAAEDEHTTSATSDAPHADTEKPQQSGTINGKLKPCQETELPYLKELRLLV